MNRKICLQCELEQPTLDTEDNPDEVLEMVPCEAHTDTVDE